MAKSVTWSQNQHSSTALRDKRESRKNQPKVAQQRIYGEDTQFGDAHAVQNSVVDRGLSFSKSVCPNTRAPENGGALQCNPQYMWSQNFSRSFYLEVYRSKTITGSLVSDLITCSPAGHIFNLHITRHYQGRQPSSLAWVQPNHWQEKKT